MTFNNTEAQNCLEEARLARAGLGDGARIKTLVDAGRFVVVESAPHFCKATDACTGTVDYYRADFDTATKAIAHLQWLCAQEGDSDNFFSIHALPAPARRKALGQF